MRTAGTKGSKAAATRTNLNAASLLRRLMDRLVHPDAWHRCSLSLRHQLALLQCKGKGKRNGVTFPWLCVCLTMLDHRQVVAGRTFVRCWNMHRARFLRHCLGRQLCMRGPDGQP